ncbi:hypothetical protein L1987_80776 [Smallanthus sonchifolius]|uniref:Uncharacterized protein n=1 Tax=Smallanthus sonchifolius TaxID=185202 RepID=A0ACB8YSW3_9ASTR|nr:hypothetical protein L1987_80776 [Smallanthus sonchifolius]
MKLLNHEMDNLSVQEYTDKFQELEQLMPQEIYPGLMLTRFLQGLAPQTGEGQDDERSESRRRVKKERKQSELEEPEEGKKEGVWKTIRELDRKRESYKGRFCQAIRYE